MSASSGAHGDDPSDSQRQNDARVAPESRFAAHESQLPLADRIASAKAPHSHVDERGRIHMDLDVDGAAALPLDHLHLAIVNDHTDHRVVDVKLIHVVHVARRQSVKGFTEEKQPPRWTKRFGALSTVGGKDSNTPGREWNNRSAELLTVFGERVNVRGGGTRQRLADDQPRILETVQPLGKYRCADSS